MPLQRLGAVRLAREHRIALALFGQRDLHDADLGRPLRPAGAAERIGEQLVAEADAEERPLELAHPLPDRALLGDQPGILLDIPHIHRPAHDPQRVIGAELRDRLALIQLDRIPRDAVLFQEFPEDARMLASRCAGTPGGAWSEPQIGQREAVDITLSGFELHFSEGQAFALVLKMIAIVPPFTKGSMTRLRTSVRLHQITA